jgi:hypothetical protein
VNRVLERILVLDGSVPYDGEVVGGKGSSIARMRSLGLSVPPAFVLPVDECRRYHAADRTLDDGLWPSVQTGSACSRTRPAGASETRRLPPRLGPFGRPP